MLKLTKTSKGVMHYLYTTVSIALRKENYKGHSVQIKEIPWFESLQYMQTQAGLALVSLLS